MIFFLDSLRVFVRDENMKANFSYTPVTESTVNDLISILGNQVFLSIRKIDAYSKGSRSSPMG